MKTIKIITMICILILAVVMGGFFAAFTVTAKGFDPHQLDTQNTLPTIIKDSSGNDIIKIQPPGPRDAPISSIPVDLQHAVISIEDSRFYENYGIDVRSLLRSLVVDLVNRSAVQGASTIPEQLAKVVYLSDEKTFSRKIKQLFYGIYIERNYSKDQILDSYLNRIYLGHGATGVTEAARVYFNKKVQDLTLSESALLAALPKAPSYFDPYVHQSDALDRRNTVLQKMLEQKYITQQQYQTAVHEPIKLTPGDPVKNDVPVAYQYFRDYLYEEADSLGISASSLANGGVTVYTSMNSSLQKAAYDMYQDPQYFPPNMSGEIVQSGAAFMNPKTGEVEAIVGGRGTYVKRGLDHATQIHRSPGSSIKPLLVYGPAVQTGQYSGDSLLFDGDLELPGYHPQDWDHNTRGQVTLRDALAESWNIPAVWLLQQIGINTGIDFATKAGLTFPEADHHKLGIALGDITNGANPLQMADAYSAFDNGGERIDPHAIIKIVDSTGNVIYDAHPTVTQVTDQATANKMTGLLENVVQNGLAAPASVPGWGVAGKTGSTEFGAHDYSDAWFCGYTPNLVGAIWMGFDSTDSNHYITGASGGSKKTAELFSAILQHGLTGNGQKFDVPVDDPTAETPINRQPANAEQVPPVTTPTNGVPSPPNGRDMNQDNRQNLSPNNTQTTPLPNQQNGVGNLAPPTLVAPTQPIAPRHRRHR